MANLTEAYGNGHRFYIDPAPAINPRPLPVDPEDESVKNVTELIFSGFYDEASCAYLINDWMRNARPYDESYRQKLIAGIVNAIAEKNGESPLAVCERHSIVEYARTETSLKNFTDEQWSQK